MSHIADEILHPPPQIRTRIAVARGCRRHTTRCTGDDADIHTGPE